LWTPREPLVDKSSSAQHDVLQASKGAAARLSLAGSTYYDFNSSNSSASDCEAKGIEVFACYDPGDNCDNM
jgi:hypothetical protein